MTTHPTPSPHDAIAKVREALEKGTLAIPSHYGEHFILKNALAALASLEPALVFSASAHRAGQEEMRERAKATAQGYGNDRNVEWNDNIKPVDNAAKRDAAFDVERLIAALPLTDNAPGAEAGVDYGQRASNMLMDAADFFAATHALADPRAWKHLLVYAPKDVHDAALREEIARLGRRVELIEEQDRKAATHVESVICMRTDFTGEPPYVGWEGLGKAMSEAFDDRDALRAQVEELTRERASLSEQFRLLYLEADEKCTALSTALAKAERERDEARAELAEAYRGLGYIDDDKSPAIDAGKGEPTT